MAPVTADAKRSLAGSRILVVGATGGLGRPLTAALAARGAQLAAAGRDVAHYDGIAFPFDLENGDEAARLVARAASSLGRLDGVVCCAGAVAFGPLDETPLDVLHRIVAIDLVGPLLLARAAVPVIAPGGFVLNVSGVVAELPTAGLVTYSAAKAGVSAGFRALAREVRSRKISIIDARPPHTQTGLAGRALHGEAPTMKDGLDPAAVAERIVLGIEHDERDLPSSSFMV